MRSPPTLPLPQNLKRAQKCKKKRALTDLIVPKGSRDILVKSQEFEQDGRHHLVGFQPHLNLNMTSQKQSWKTMKNKSAISQESFV